MEWALDWALEWALNGHWQKCVPTFAIRFWAGLSWPAIVSLAGAIHQPRIDFPCLERTWVSLLMPLCSDQFDLVQLWAGWDGFLPLSVAPTVAKSMCFESALSRNRISSDIFGIRRNSSQSDQTGTSFLLMQNMVCL